MTIEQQSHFAAYYNMARRNMFVTLNHIAKLAGLPAEKDNDKESKLEELEVVKKLLHGTAEQKEHIKSLLDKHMPFIKPIVESWRKSQKSVTTNHKMYASVLARWCKVLCYYRDKYTHCYFYDNRTNRDEFIDTEKRVVQDLNLVFTAAAVCIKNRFSLTTELEFLTQGRYKRANVPILDDNGLKQYDKDGKLITKNIPIINTLFFYCLQDNDGRLNDMGIIFFLCQFIEKKYATMLFDQQGYKGYTIYGNHSETRRRYIREVFSACRLNMPRNRMDTERNEVALAMDMLNELRRCPEELFDVIAPDQQEKFRIISETGDEVLLRRSSDRFPTLAMQYLDYTQAFADIRFQVSLGKYRYKFYNKTCVDGCTYVRSLQKELNGFGRINEIEEKRKELWSDKIRQFDDVECDTADTKPYITDHHAQYVFHANRVGLYFNDTHHQGLQHGFYLPPIQDDKAPCLQARCWLSIYDMPALIFHHLLTKKEQPRATEDIIKKVCKNYYDFFSAVADGKLTRSGKPQDDFAHIRATYGIERTDIPRDLQDYFTGKHRTGYEALVCARLNKMIAENDEQLQKHRKKQEKVLSPDMRYGKRDFTTIKPGYLAGLLARDIVFFMPNAEDKPTGKNFSVMQATLATFDVTKSLETLYDIRNMFCQMNAIGWCDENESRNHPFLEEVFEPKEEKQNVKNVVDFYEKYLVCRKEYLENILKKKEYDKVPRCKREKERDENFYRERATNYLNKSIELPRGLFDAALKEALAVYPELSDDMKKESCNTTYLITRYMQVVCGDDSQQFYNIPRHYRCLDLDILEKDGDKPAKRVLKYLTLDERNNEIANLKKSVSESILKGKYFDLPQDVKAKKSKKEFYAEQKEEIKKKLLFMENTERTLRRYRVQDMLMYLAACDIVAGVSKSDFGYRLSMIAGNDEQQFFDYEMPHFEMPITLPNGKTCKLTQKNLKLKNYGDFFRFIYDMRVHTLLANGTREEIERTLLEEELDAYDGCRPEVFRILLTIEKRVVDTHPHMKGQRVQFLNVLNAMTECGETEKEVMRLIRNAFSHNNYPSGLETDYDKLPHVAKSLRDLLPKVD